MRPTFVFSLDTELIWGSFDILTAARFERRYPDVRGTIERIIAMLGQFDMPATWALVGHLFLGSCDRGADGRAHPELTRPSYRWHRDDWFGHDPCSDRARAPLWYGDDIVQMLLAAGGHNEIAAQSFSHLVYGDPGCGPAAAADDLQACVAAAARWGITLRSFVFPREKEGHLDLLPRAGFRAYRGSTPTWVEGVPGIARRAASLADHALAIAPPVSVPAETRPGLWDIPASMFLLERRGVRRAVPLSSRVAKAMAGLRRAVAEEAVFHLWLHPFNLAHRRDEMLGVLRTILAEVARLRDNGSIEAVTMGDLAAQLAAA